jgi:hypothetical protein
MSDRSVRLDLAAGGLAERQAANSGGRGERGPASEDDMARFRQTLADPGREAQDAGGDPAARDAWNSSDPAARGAAPQTQARGAFGLFGRARGGGAAPAEAASGMAPGAWMAPGALAALLPAREAPAADPTRGEMGTAAAADRARIAEQVAERILVSADGGREVRVSIRDEVLPGVELRLTQEQGRWVACFVATDAASLELLARAGEWMAGQLARRLRCGVEIRLAKGPDAADEPTATFLAESPAEDAAPSGQPEAGRREAGMPAWRGAPR